MSDRVEFFVFQKFFLSVTNIFNISDLTDYVHFPGGESGYMFVSSTDSLKGKTYITEILWHFFEHQIYGLAPTEIIFNIATNFILRI